PRLFGRERTRPTSQHPGGRRSAIGRLSLTIRRADRFHIWHRVGSSHRVPLRKRASRLLAATFIVCTALVSVGLTAPADGPFSITIRPILVRLAIDIDVKFGLYHFHTCWSALQDTAG